jgi:hypothetical protein
MTWSRPSSRRADTGASPEGIDLEDLYPTAIPVDRNCRGRILDRLVEVVPVAAVATSWGFVGWSLLGWAGAALGVASALVAAALIAMAVYRSPRRPSG